MKTLSYRQLQKRLKAHDSRFQFLDSKGKGSHRAIVHPDIDGQQVLFTLPVHGEGADIKKHYIPPLRRIFKLPKDFFD